MNRLQELKVKASLLRKHLRSSDPSQQLKAAQRFLQLPFLKYSKVDVVLNDADFYQLKHAYWVLAIENNYDTWQLYRDAIIAEDCMYTQQCGAYLNVWIANYDEAKQYHKEHGGYLLQYRKDYVVCTEEVIKVLGLDSFSEEWEAIGYDWVKPNNKAAWNTIFKTAKKNYIERSKASKENKPIDKSKRPEWLNI